ncbi:hypothetical protein [Streptomyces albidus (ex Kaewkla and Franco 2022)]|uniref:hypothetical protein n=1 Tax=Streptomyces albidus (ex Kaewkla and Franco 2022) TaxID=722709 RepID=UPI0015EF4A74|nr:hypothetical protein [Streptomyces albidus (ex Kaewkla and Franco 2022)]
MKIAKPAATLFAVTALLAGSTAVASAATPASDFRAEALSDGLTSAQADSLQKRVDAVLDGQPGGRQVSATKVEYDGLTVTVDPRSKSSTGKTTKANLACGYGHLCITVRGANFDFYKCQKWNVSNWYGDGTFENNQTPGTVARFYNQDGSERWHSVAYQKGTATWDPIYSLRPC